MYYRHTNPFIAGTFARSEDVNFKFDEIEAAFARLMGTRLVMERNFNQGFMMDGNAYGKMILASYQAPTDTFSNNLDTHVTIGQAVVEYSDNQVEMSGAIMFLCNDSDGHIYIVPADGVILTGGSDRLYQKGSVVAFVAISENEWLCVGDFAEPELYL